MDIHRINDHHEHIGLIYFARPVGGELKLAEGEHHDIQWCTAAQLHELEPALPPSVRWYALKALEEVGSGNASSSPAPQTRSAILSAPGENSPKGYFALCPPEPCRRRREES